VRAAGATPLLRLPLFSGPAIAALQPTGAPLVALSPAGEDIDAFVFPPTFGLLPGVEGPGLPAAAAWTALRIPMRPGVESLNAATATAIALHRWYAAQACEA
jgi:16S rRNA (guanine527-N7)-methyltransferase